jgi:mediator of RNA polymerase II transcription subunit 10
MSTETGNENNTPLGNVQNDLASLIETCVHLGVQVHDFQGTAEAQRGLAAQVNCAIEQLEKISHEKSVENIFVPSDLVGYVGDGRNPDIYTREFVEVVRRINQNVAGESIALNDFQKVLGAKMVQEFPELEGVVRKIIE